MGRIPFRLRTLAITALFVGVHARLRTNKRTTTTPTVQERKSRRQVKAELRELELQERKTDVDERRFKLFRQKVFLGLTILMVAVTVYCTLRGVHWSIPVVTGGSSFAVGAAAVFEGRRAKPGPDD